jgi:hypothetical protein
MESFLVDTSLRRRTEQLLLKFPAAVRKRVEAVMMMARMVLRL